jgi:hypothetical protein
MKHLKIIILSLFFYQSSLIAQSKGVYQYLKQDNGKYPTEVKLLGNKQLKSALIAILGSSRFNFLKENFNVENPIEINNGIVTAVACQQHNCGDTNFIIVIDTGNDKVYAGIRENGTAKIYPANAVNQKQLVNWLNN